MCEKYGRTLIRRVSLACVVYPPISDPPPDEISEFQQQYVLPFFFFFFLNGRHFRIDPNKRTILTLSMTFVLTNMREMHGFCVTNNKFAVRSRVALLGMLSGPILNSIHMSCHYMNQCRQLTCIMFKLFTDDLQTRIIFFFFLLSFSNININTWLYSYLD